MLDTDTVSFALRGVGAVAARLAKHKRSELCLSAITVAELRFGADKRRARKIHQAIDAFLSGVDVLAFDNSAAEKFGTIAAALATSGEPIGQMNTLIAGHGVGGECDFGYQQSAALFKSERPQDRELGVTISAAAHSKATDYDAR